MKKIVLAGALSLGLFGIPCGYVNAEARSLSLEQALDLALENNVSVRQERINLALAEKEAETSWNKFLPGISLSGSLRKVHDLPNASVPVPEAKPEIGVSAGVSLSLNAGIPEAIRQAFLARDAARASRDRVEATLRASVSKAYYSLVSDGASLEAGEQSLALAENQEAQTEKNYRSGLSSELEWLQAQYSAASLRQDLLVKRQQYGNSLRSFNALIGLDLGTEIALSDGIEPKLTPVTRPVSLDAFIDSRNDVVSALFTLERARSASLGVTLTRYGPTISFSESASVSGLQNEVVLPETATFSVNVSIPLDNYVPGSKGSAATRQAAAAVETAALNLEKARVTARQEIESLYASLDQLREGIALKQMNERIAERAFDLSAQGYASGLVTQSALDEARSRLLSAKLAVLAARYSYQAALIDLAVALNVKERDLHAIAGGK